jgi:PQQ-like domain
VADRHNGRLIRTGATRLVAVVGMALIVSALWWTVAPEGRDVTLNSTATTTTTAPAATTTSTTAPPATTTTRPPFVGWVDPASANGSFPKSTVEGLLTFRGNPTRTFYGRGPVPTRPAILWSYPKGTGGMCGPSSDTDGVQTWCGTGWNGQPAVWEYSGKTWVAFGAYDYGVHFLNAADGANLLPTLRTGDLAKGTVTVDPDGFPLLYHGSRDNFLRVVAFDRTEPTVLWKLGANETGTPVWNDDWDGSPLILDDYLFEGGENSRIHIVKLNRSYGPDGKVRVDPKLVWHAPSWDDELTKVIFDKQFSIESSVAISGSTLYFANSAGLVQGWDISTLKTGGTPTRTFRFWTGDDTDATIVIDDEGFLYVASEWERQNQRSREVGQIMKLDPRKADNPLVWSIKDQGPSDAGVWATPGLYKDMLYVPTNSGELLGIDRATGNVRWRKKLQGPLWQSPVIVNDVLLLGDCLGVLRAFDVRNTAIEPPQLWSVQLTGCVESTPAVWNGRIYVGARGGKFYAIGDP